MTTAPPADLQLLHVEDSELDARALQRAFKKLGIKMNILRAKDGVEALETLSTREPDLGPETPTVVLLDINMPRMNGIEFLKSLRSDPRIASTPVFVLTTSDRPDDIRDAYEHNVAGYIVKPMASGTFIDQIRQWYNFLSVIEFPRHA